MDQNDKTLNWYTETMQFQTMREAHEWVYSGSYNEIGKIYDGLITKDDKIAYALVFELTRRKTLVDHPADICCDVVYGENTLTYRVWVTNN